MDLAEANNTETGRLATRVMDRMPEDRQALSPAFWALILQIITELINNCPTDSKGATKIANKPRFWGKRVLIVTVKRSMGGGRNYRQRGGSEIVEAMLDEGEDVTKTQMAAMFEEA